MHELFINALGALIGGLILTFILFAFNEWIYRKKNLSNEWDVVEVINNSTRQEMLGITLKFKFHLLQKGYEISGSGEKISETRLNTSEYNFEFDKRVTLTFSGYIERNFLKKSKVYLNIVEDGRERESRTTYSLILIDENRLTGTLVSTAANAKGQVELTRNI